MRYVSVMSAIVVSEDGMV